jgi:CHAT domain-containing protein
VLTACWMGAMEFDESHEVTAFNTVLTMRGARRITSALWAVDDRMAVVFAAAYARALRDRCFGALQREPFAFARALKDAVAAIRTAEGGRFDHEFFWAPWVLYGIGGAKKGRDVPSRGLAQPFS